MQHHRLIMNDLGIFGREIFILIRTPVFISLTIVGNGLIGLSGFAFYLLESGINPKVTGFIDCIWWSFATATTTGYGDITPVTFSGKILGILLMLMGTALFAMFTGLFAEIILTHASKHKNHH